MRVSFNANTWSLMQSTDSNLQNKMNMMMDFNQEQHIQTIKGRHDIFLCKQLNLFRDAKVDLRTNSVFSQQRKKTYPTTIFYDLKYHDNRLTMYQSFCKEPCDFEFSPSELATG